VLGVLLLKRVDAVQHVLDTEQENTRPTANARASNAND
jgi:hypothetical protein